LSSQEKIDATVSQQNEEIESGGLEDTNLLVGDAVRDDDYDVVDAGTIENQVGFGPLLAALQNDITIDNPTDFDQGQLFDERAAPFISKLFGFDGDGPDGTVDILVGRDIIINSSTIDLNDFGAEEFAFVAGHEIKLTVPLLINSNFPKEVTFLSRLGLFVRSITNPNGSLYLQGDEITIAPISTLEAYGQELSLDSEKSPNINGGVTFRNLIGDISIRSGNSISFATGPTFNAPNGAVRILSGNNVNINGGSFTASSVDIFAGQNINVNATSFSSAMNANLVADAMVFNNVAFMSGSSVNFFTRSGNWSTLAPVTGGVFLNGCSYGSPITGSGGPGVIVGNMNSFSR
jgi:hypothetical protein